MENTKPQTSKAEITNRDWLYDHEIAAMIAAVKKAGGRHALRDATLLLLSYRHGLRSAEAAALTWDCVNMTGRQYNLVVNRRKNSESGNHPLAEEEIRALKRLQSSSEGPYLFASQKGGALTTRMIRYIVEEAGRLAGLPFPVHPHMLRHATGYKLANAGTDTRTIQEYLGHRNIQNTVRYTKLAANRFKDVAKVL